MMVNGLKLEDTPSGDGNWFSERKMNCMIALLNSSGIRLYGRLCTVAHCCSLIVQMERSTLGTWCLGATVEKIVGWTLLSMQANSKSERIPVTKKP